LAFENFQFITQSAYSSPQFLGLHSSKLECQSTGKYKREAINNGYGIRKGKLWYCAGYLIARFVYRLSKSRTRITMVYTIKPVLYSMLVKKGNKKIQKTAL
jgi:hypothetical protein